MLGRIYKPSEKVSLPSRERVGKQGKRLLSPLPWKESYTNYIDTIISSCRFQPNILTPLSLASIDKQYTCSRQQHHANPRICSDSLACSRNGNRRRRRLRRVTVVKVLSGRDLKDGEFSFQLKDSDDNVLQEKTNAADGKVTFDPIVYTGLPLTSNVHDRRGRRYGRRHDVRSVGD